jgi:hypothetical protein
LALVRVNLVETGMPVFLVAYLPLEAVAELGRVTTEVQAAAPVVALQVLMPHQQVRQGKETLAAMQAQVVAEAVVVLGL